MALTLPIITKHDLEQAKDWGDGYCIVCGELQASLRSERVLHACDSCGEIAVLSADSLQQIARRICWDC